MAAKKSKLTVTEDKTVEQARRNYQMLKRLVEQWREERGSYWRQALTLADEPPYLPVRDLPAEAVIELWKRLNVAAQAEAPDSVLQKIWEQFRDQKAAETDAEMSGRLQIAVSGAASLAGKLVAQKRAAADNAGQGAGGSMRCPVCGQISILAVLTPPDGKRIGLCTLCGYQWPVKRVGCLYCGSVEAKEQIYLQNEAYPGVEMAVCRLCGQYCKEIDERKLSVQDYVWEDLRTLPLNYAAERWSAENKKKTN